jgi:hypothetical protein
VFEVLEDDLVSLSKIKDESEVTKHSFGSSEFASYQLKGYSLLNTVHFLIQRSSDKFIVRDNGTSLGTGVMLQNEE